LLLLLGGRQRGEGARVRGAQRGQRVAVLLRGERGAVARVLQRAVVVGRREEVALERGHLRRCFTTQERRQTYTLAS